MAIEKRKNEITINEVTVIEKFPVNPKIFECLGLMFKNYFNITHIWNDVDIDEYSPEGIYLKAKFDYYLKVYNLIQNYWRELEAIFKCISTSEKITQIGELFILILKNDCLNWQDHKIIDKCVCRNVFEGWYEFQKCKASGKNSQKLDDIIRRIKKKSKFVESENSLIFDLIYSVISKQDKSDFERNEEFNVIDINVRHLRNLEYRRYTT